MTRYVFIAFLGFAGGYTWGNADGLAVGVQLAPVLNGQLSPY